MKVEAGKSQIATASRGRAQAPLIQRPTANRTLERFGSFLSLASSCIGIKCSASRRECRAAELRDPIRAANSKNGEGRTVAVSGDLAELMKRRRAERQVETKGGVALSAYVFHRKGEPIGDFRKAWSTACVAARLGQFVCDRCNKTMACHRCEKCKGEARYTGRIFHDLRRTAVRNMVRAGVPERVAMTIIGHKTRAIFDRYNIVNEADLREAMQRTQGFLKNAGQQPRNAAAIQMRAAQSQSFFRDYGQFTDSRPQERRAAQGDSR